MTNLKNNNKNMGAEHKRLYEMINLQLTEMHLLKIIINMLSTSLRNVMAQCLIQWTLFASQWHSITKPTTTRSMWGCESITTPTTADIGITATFLSQYSNINHSLLLYCYSVQIFITLTLPIWILIGKSSLYSS